MAATNSARSTNLNLPKGIVFTTGDSIDPARSNSLCKAIPPAKLIRPAFIPPGPTDFCHTGEVKA